MRLSRTINLKAEQVYIYISIYLWIWVWLNELHKYICIVVCLNSYFEGICSLHKYFLMLFAISTANNSCIYVFRHLINANAINLPQDHKTQRGTQTLSLCGTHTCNPFTTNHAHTTTTTTTSTRHSQLTWSQNVVLGEHLAVLVVVSCMSSLCFKQL